MRGRKISFPSAKQYGRRQDRSHSDNHVASAEGEGNPSHLIGVWIGYCEEKGTSADIARRRELVQTLVRGPATNLLSTAPRGASLTRGCLLPREFV
jgi:hypothetical protein